MPWGQDLAHCNFSALEEDSVVQNAALRRMRSPEEGKLRKCGHCPWALDMCLTSIAHQAWGDDAESSDDRQW